MHVYNKNNKPEAHIENWGHFRNGLLGMVSKHPRQEEFHTELQNTSRLVELNEEEGWAETNNTFYTLGKRAY